LTAHLESLSDTSVAYKNRTWTPFFTLSPGVVDSLAFALVI
jgi:hypothetical protein